MGKWAMNARVTAKSPDSFEARVAEHGRVRALLESFAYIKPFGDLFGKSVPFYAESYWYALGGLTILSFAFLVLRAYPITLAARKVI